MKVPYHAHNYGLQVGRTDPIVCTQRGLGGFEADLAHRAFVQNGGKPFDFECVRFTLLFFLLPVVDFEEIFTVLT